MDINKQKTTLAIVVLKTLVMLPECCVENTSHATRLLD
uniref:Uncharacterized protein n=1 Tax=Timema poppense TaxID=170557 RepID=A0A7R9DWP3_TIMPO|nr:unnamed protein product [Timema poppensis]